VAKGKFLQKQKIPLAIAKGSVPLGFAKERVKSQRVVSVFFKKVDTVLSSDTNRFVDRYL